MDVTHSLMFFADGLVVTAAGEAGPKTDPAEENAEDMKVKLWDNESVEGWSNTWTADVTSVYFTTVAFLPLLQKAKDIMGEYSSSVVTISSMSGMMRHAQAHFAYNAAKGGTIHLTKLMSAEFQKTGIRVNSIAPGYFPSELTAKGSRDDQKSELDPSYVQSKGHVPLNRPGWDQEMAQAVVSTRALDNIPSFKRPLTHQALSCQVPIRDGRDPSSRRRRAERSGRKVEALARWSGCISDGVCHMSS